MARYTDDDRAAAVERYRIIGLTAAAAELGIPARTITRWADAAGVTTDVTAVTAAATEAAAATLAQRKMRIAERLADEIEACLDQLHGAVREERLLVDGIRSKTVVHHRKAPTFAERKTIMTTLAIAVDKLQVLTGGVTERIGLQGDEQVQHEAARVLQLVRGTG